MKIAVAGTGYVGLVTGTCLAGVGHTVVCVDKNEAKIEKLRRGESPIYEPGLEVEVKATQKAGKLSFTIDYKKAYLDADVIIVGVATPENADGSASLQALYAVCGEIAESIEKPTLVVIKSTVPIGTNDKLASHFKRILGEDRQGFVEIASNPEFLSQGTALRDTLHAERIVIGTESAAATETLTAMYAPFGQPILTMNRRSAEMVKYASNDFLALKISFVNDIANLCEVVGADIEEVTRGMGTDSRIGKQFLSPGIGYGGSCFPKDTKALHWLSEEEGYTLRTVQAAIAVNEKQRFKLIQAARKDIPQFTGKKIAVLGATFKPGTDDLREAPSIPNLQLLLNHGADVHVYDPVGLPNLANAFGDSLTYGDSIANVLENADACFIFTEWQEIKEMDLALFQTMSEPLVYDGRNCFSLQAARDAGLSYYSIGRAKIGGTVLA
ncbi:nucleotide sugar dehydrogenase [Listeria weihenstephanensis FSL R9-0317]|uniref:UDP-glucose 6-dehydrogenase n=1 Tax=Listeria weihenstephanensis TaxID=1006155 RepID=A0A1S7FSR0_9LIST|nr:UDP-glucose/GDP-mannose dehydrogenase family protein [Listeria weihenstephanensis]AQY50385.1 UDP-glucose 6-dehydrogenase [Listeria weihenstephanensis]EUJ35028.1 nucleotide sugar dehydrogenase [Listeria weihenstephanensis FSL R9-0317]MBC1501442.1 UDP-glucose/GDP-mannose dehydrogenase family protein [Listeria weihenstephanensis]